jgi:short-subunit dehydrogenase involved in D-alanine esterification of teichoic acids
MSKYPDIDCVFLNAGIQHRHDLSQPETFDLAKFNSEIHVNFTSFVALAMAFLPFLKAQETQTSFIM